MKPGSAIINAASINSDMPNPTLLAYATTKGAIQNFTAGARLDACCERNPRKHRSTGADLDAAHTLNHAEDAVEQLGQNVPMKRPGQPIELATTYVMLARSALELRLQRDHRSHRREADPVIYGISSSAHLSSAPAFVAYKREP